MTVVNSNVFRLNVIAIGNSLLSQRASQLGVNEWLQMNGAYLPTDQNVVLSDNGNTGSLIPFCNAMPWNPVTRRIDISGQDHDGGGQNYVVYNEQDNRFYQLATAWNANGHGYNHNVVNPVTGDMWVRQYGVSSSITIWKKLSGETTFANATTLSPGVTYTGVANGLCWWRGAFNGGGGGGAQGTMFHVGEGIGSGGIHGCIKGYNPLTNTWFFTKNDALAGTADTNAYHGVAQYSAVKNCMVYGGGNQMDNRLWRMDVDGNVLEMPNIPSGKNCGAATAQGKLVADPVSGNFLLLSALQLWELNPSGSGSWTQRANPPASLPNPNLLSNCHVIAIELFDHGCVAFIGQPASAGGTFWLYRNA